MKLVAKTIRDQKLDERDQKINNLMKSISKQAGLIGSVACLMDDLTENSGPDKMDYDHIRTCRDLLQEHVAIVDNLEDELDAIEGRADIR